MAERVCIFVDGENFRYSIASLFSNFQRSDYLPKSADWTALFDWIVKSATGDGVRVRTYWYVIASVDFYPYRFPDAKAHGDRLFRLLSRHSPYRTELASLSGDDLQATMERIVGQLNERQSRMVSRANGWLVMQNGIAARHKAVEFRRAGAITYSLFESQFQNEKAVDVKLATDLIVLRDIYDVALILSGDQDYVPAVEVVKDSGKRVINVAFRTRGGQMLPGGARRLNQVTDWSLEVDYHDLGRYLGLVPQLSESIDTAVQSSSEDGPSGEGDQLNGSVE